MATNQQAIEDCSPVGLEYTADGVAGISRRRAGKGFTYRDAAGRTLRDRRAIERIRRLAIPPAWTDVWISANPRGHLQATGRDARGRKQYRYHPEWRTWRDSTKFERTAAFAERLPALRRAVSRHLSHGDLGPDTVVAAVVALLDTGFVRVGNTEYARQNGSYGATTLKTRHASIRGDDIALRFQGKGGKRQMVQIRHPRLAAVVRRCQDLPGQALFQYVDEAGQVHSVGSQQVNDYIREHAGASFTAKDFRTWAATVLATAALRRADGRPARATVSQAIEAVAGCLGHTPTICRNCYIHPGVITCFLEGRLDALEPVEIRGLRRDEQFALAVLRGG